MQPNAKSSSEHTSPVPIRIPGPVRIPSSRAEPDAKLSDLAFASAGRPDIERGLLGWLSFVMNGVIRVDGIAVRRTREGRLRISYPTRNSRSGQQHSIVRPASPEARAAIEQTIFEALGINQSVQR